MSFPIKQITPFTHISIIHDTFPILFDKLVMDFGMFKIKINSLNGSSNTRDVTKGLMTALDLQKASSQRPVQAGCANGSYFKNDPYKL
jgi:hypothetical protein